MTTVAWRGSVLAADEGATEGSRQATCHKLLRMPGRAYGCSGDLSDIWEFFQGLTSGLELDEIKLRGNDFSCLMLTPDGCYQMARDLRPFPVFGEYWAIGSGAEYAIGAMYHGHSARQAVEAAIAHDADSCGSVRYCNIKQRRR